MAGMALHDARQGTSQKSRRRVRIPLSVARDQSDRLLAIHSDREYGPYRGFLSELPILWYRKLVLTRRALVLCCPGKSGLNRSEN